MRPKQLKERFWAKNKTITLDRKGWEDLIKFGRELERERVESVIQQEIDWCKSHAKTKGEKDFLKGVQQSLYLLKKLQTLTPKDTN